MENNRDGFFFYRSFFEAIQLVPNEQSKLKLYQALAEYGILGKDPNIDGWELALFATWKTNTDNSIARREASIKNGVKGGRPKSVEAKPNKNLVEPNRNQKVEVEKPKNNLDNKKKPIDNPNNNINNNSEFVWVEVDEFPLNKSDLTSITSDYPLTGVIGESMIRIIDNDFNFENRYNELLKNNPSTSFDDIIKELLIQYNEKYDILSIVKLDVDPFIRWSDYKKLLQAEAPPILIFYEMVKSHQYMLSNSDPRISRYINPF